MTLLKPLLWMSMGLLMGACAAPRYDPIVEDLSVLARPSERIPTSGAQATDVSAPVVAPVTLSPQAKQHQAATTTAVVTAQPIATQIKAEAKSAPQEPSNQSVVITQPAAVPDAPLPESDQAVVEQLLAEADQLKAQGKVTQAVIQLQRAQRIAPREPKVYARLAALQLSLGEASRAEQLSLKGLTLVPNQQNYQYYFWKLIAASRSHLGNVSGEAEAIGEAAKYK
ncbi:MAG: hypothetical protein PSN46_01875 [Gammaproteobacteria bacterium]|nr:hypothetical protein [Gammaproteobacteria bacterium]